MTHMKRADRVSDKRDHKVLISHGQLNTAHAMCFKWFFTFFFHLTFFLSTHHKLCVLLNSPPISINLSYIMITHFKCISSPVTQFAEALNNTHHWTDYYFYIQLKLKSCHLLHHRIYNRPVSEKSENLFSWSRKISGRTIRQWLHWQSYRVETQCEITASLSVIWWFNWANNLHQTCIRFCASRRTHQTTLSLLEA